MRYSRNRVRSEVECENRRIVCNACGCRLWRVSDQLFFLSSLKGELHTGFLCLKCADEYESKFLKKRVKINHE